MTIYDENTILLSFFQIGFQKQIFFFLNHLLVLASHTQIPAPISKLQGTKEQVEVNFDVQL